MGIIWICIFDVKVLQAEFYQINEMWNKYKENKNYLFLFAGFIFLLHILLGPVSVWL